MNDQPKTTPITRVEVDLNIRANGNQARVGFEDANGPLQAGQVVEVYESESGLTGVGTVTAINTTQRLAWLAVYWPGLAEAAAEPDETDATETDIDRMMAAGIPVQIVTGPPGTRGSQPTMVTVGGAAPALTGNPAYDAVYAYIRGLGDHLPPDPAHRNAIIWRAVHAALDARPGTCDATAAHTANPAQPEDDVAALHLTYRLPRGI